VPTKLMARARSGDGEAFRELIGPHRRELMVHCYRILGSTQDAEDALQETMLAAWQGLHGFEDVHPSATWLYRIATNRCLNALRSGSRRPGTGTPPPAVAPLEPTGLAEVTWLEPLPDDLIEGLADRSPGPETRYETREAISLAFVTALQLLPPRQRAVLILRDVLGFRAREAADMLESTEESVTSALKRARAAMRSRLGPAGQREPPPSPGSPAEQHLVARLSQAFERARSTTWSRCSPRTCCCPCRRCRSSTRAANWPASSSPPCGATAATAWCRRGPTASRRSRSTCGTRMPGWRTPTDCWWPVWPGRGSAR